MSAYSFVPDVLNSSTTYTSTTLTNASVASLYAAGSIKPGMIIDTLHATICTGRVQSVAGNVITVDVWYARSGGGPTTPASSTGAIINPNNKIFGQNIVVSAAGNGTTTGSQKFSGVELNLGTPPSATPIAGTWGYDIAITSGSYIDLGFQVRGKRNISYFSNNAGGAGLFGFYSIGDATAFRSDDAVDNAWEGWFSGVNYSKITKFGVGTLTKLGVGTTPGSSIFDVTAPSGLGATASNITHNVNTQNAISLINTDTTGNNKFCNFISDTGYIERGSIDFNRGGGVTRYNTASDKTLKTRIGAAPVERSIEILDTTVLEEYFWNDDATKKPQIGPFAQDLHTTFKGAVSVGGEYQGEDEGGNEVTKYRPWMVDKTAFTYHLIAGYQYQAQQIKTLSERLLAIEELLNTK
jgi:hypothetical protein